jgi:hypothetical protein
MSDSGKRITVPERETRGAGGAGRATGGGRGDHRWAGTPGQARDDATPAGCAARAASAGHDRAGRPVLPAAPFSRPARSAVTLAARAFGLTGVVLAQA